jgi:hypothetical protein
MGHRTTSGTPVSLYRHRANISYDKLMRVNRLVELSNINNKGKYGGSHYKTWGYTYRDLSVLFNTSEQQIRNLVYEKKLDPSSLWSIIDYWNEACLLTD